MATKRRAKETFSRWDAADYLKPEVPTTDLYPGVQA